ncbi:hypothetical protein LDENG_00288360 [Lucifuga dentata]|nr:hypothetical protein LDENG_00288360 [Lucifuga dentata]
MHVNLQASLLVWLVTAEMLAWMLQYVMLCVLLEIHVWCCCYTHSLQFKPKEQHHNMVTTFNSFASGAHWVE